MTLVTWSCEHGNVRRKCEICERDDEIAQLRADREELIAALIEALSYVSEEEISFKPHSRKLVLNDYTGTHRQ